MRIVTVIILSVQKTEQKHYNAVTDPTHFTKLLVQKTIAFLTKSTKHLHEACVCIF